MRTVPKRTKIAIRLDAGSLPGHNEAIVLSSPSSDSSRTTTVPNREGTSEDLLGALRERIRSGTYAAGSWLPAERDLAEEFGIQRRAVRRAIDRLAAEGLVRCRPRFRPVVEGPAPMSPVRSNSAPGPSVSSSRLIALIMRHGDADGQSATAQQRIFWGMNRRLAREGYHGVFLDLSDTTTENAARDAEHLRYVVDQGFAGAVFYAEAFRHNRELIQETAERLPLVLVDRLVPGVRTDFVGVDNFGAMHAATRHLLELGHRRLLYITNAEPIHTVQDRLNGFRQALQEIARPPLSEHIVTAIADWSVAEWPVFDGFFRQAADQRPTAILCVNDYTAALAYGRLRTLGLSVPKDVSLCGFDDVIPLLPNGIGLTTMAQPFEQIGRSAAERILAHRAIAAAPAPAFLELPARLIPRTSTAPPADADRKSPAPNSILAQQTT